MQSVLQSGVSGPLRPVMLGEVDRSVEESIVNVLRRAVHLDARGEPEEK